MGPEECVETDELTGWSDNYKVLVRVRRHRGLSSVES